MAIERIILAALIAVAAFHALGMFAPRLRAGLVARLAARFPAVARLRRFLPLPPSAAGGACGSGCHACGTCATRPAAPTASAFRVIHILRPPCDPR